MANPEEELVNPKEHERKSKPVGGDASSSGNQSIGNGNVIKGDIKNIVINNAPGANTASQSSDEILECPLCGRRNRIDSTFRCTRCGQNDLCLDHLDATTHICRMCIEADSDRASEFDHTGESDKHQDNTRLVACIMLVIIAFVFVLSYVCSFL